MKLIIKIARMEIRNLFYSPVAWFLAIAFLAQCAYFYSVPIIRYADWQDLSFNNSPDFIGFGSSLTNSIFLGTDGIFSNVMNNLYLFLPLLTMGLISREINSGTIKLLYSSPIKTYHIVFGKYFAIVFYNLILLGMVGVFVVLGTISIVEPDTGILLSAMLGLFLLICAYSAIGIFMSSLTTYQIVSAVSTFLIILILTRIGGLWQQYDFVRELTYFLSLDGRTVKMVGGLLTTSDVIYFLLIIFMFLSFTLFKVRSAMESKPLYNKVIQYFAVVLVVLVVGYISSRQTLIGYWDTSRDNVNTIHPNTQEVLQAFEANEPLEVTLYANILGGGFDRGGLPETRKTYETSFWEKYLRFKSDIKLKYVYYYDVMEGDSTYYKRFPNKSLKEIAELMAQGLNVDLAGFKSPEEMKKEIDLKPEGKRLVMQLKYKERKSFLRTFEDGGFWPSEMNVSASFKRLQAKEMPKVLYTSGNLERNIYKRGEREYDLHTININNRMSLVNLGFDVDSIDLDKSDIPANTSILTIADPKTELSIVKQNKIKQYITDGGSVYFVGEPGKQQILNPLLENLGVQLNPGVLVEVTHDEMPDMVKPYLTEEALILSDLFYLDRGALKEGKAILEYSMFMQGVAEVADIDPITPFKRLPIANTLPLRDAFNRIGKLVTDSVPPVFNPLEGDSRKETFVTLMGLSRSIQNKEQRILVSGDADFMSSRRGGGSAFTVALYSWLDNNRFPIYAPIKKATDVLLSVSFAAVKIQEIVFLWILPGFIILLASVILIRRKRK